MRVLVALAALTMTMAWVSGESVAQKKKGCPANYESTCQASCMKAGGQPRKCPQYCAKRLRENCAT
ncbi:hypothetical protein GJW-30_1_02301 [Variibacter gotjawalensis]|uniref:Uncharacterized protein n=1 Tax=Variibacter gotjawalensis TaxID=1333996 RepID=A0A0S3PV16_9BRAD|nr:hypothetical protein [Variibacter gotjawalensis]NIK50094.1 hypothetical protein [Variibacter gotjawalensis]RZS46093.1 hypothetical protein EV661_4419 [Variibacter gotjawalensis]BAT59768.1 hypothetical protein GJW-30_1_02301 [Variibacter gotjawalensis]